MSKESSKSGGIGFLGLLTIVFIILKLCGVINWSWIWVLAPLWLPIIISIFIVGCVVLIAFLKSGGRK